MEVEIVNNGARDIRVIVDGNTIDDLVLKASERGSFVTSDAGTLQLREYGDSSSAGGEEPTPEPHA